MSVVVVIGSAYLAIRSEPVNNRVAPIAIAQQTHSAIVSPKADVFRLA
jgi:hypothetical protein